LMDSIRRVGQQEPVKAVRREGGGYWIVDGGRRLEACRRLGLKSIRLVELQLNPQQVLDIAWTSQQRRNFTALEQLLLFRRVVRTQGEGFLTAFAQRHGIRDIEAKKRMMEALEAAGLFALLHAIEKASGFTFNFSHLEVILRREREAWPVLAAFAAANQLSAKRLQEVAANMPLQALEQVLPAWARNLTREELEESQGGPALPSEAEQEQREQGGVVLVGKAYAARCGACGANVFFRAPRLTDPRLSSLVLLRPREEGLLEKQEVLPELLLCRVACTACGAPLLLALGPYELPPSLAEQLASYARREGLHIAKDLSMGTLSWDAVRARWLFSEGEPTAPRLHATGHSAKGVAGEVM